MKSLKKIIEDTIKKSKTFKPSKNNNPRFQPSMLGSPCLRKIFYSYSKTEPDYEAPLSLNQMAYSGDLWGEALYDLLSQNMDILDYQPLPSDFPKDREFPVEDLNLSIRGKIDAIALLPDNEIQVIEFKTSSNSSFEKLKAPKPPHQVQGLIYLVLFRYLLQNGRYSHIKELNDRKPPNSITFIYVNRDNGQIKEFHQNLDFEDFKKIVEKMEIVKRHHQDQTLPPTKFDWCKSCTWRKKCVQNRLK